MADASIQILGLDKLQAGVNAAPATLAREIKAGMVAGSKLVEATQRDLAPRFTGDLIGSIASTVTATSATIGPKSPYARWADQGRRPGKPPPVSAIEPWARAKGLNPYLVARAIGRHGTKGKRFVEPSLTTNLTAIVRLFEQAGAKVVARMAA